VGANGSDGTREYTGCVAAGRTREYAGCVAAGCTREYTGFSGTDGTDRCAVEFRSSAAHASRTTFSTG
jgi:hypothetical protein